MALRDGVAVVGKMMSVFQAEAVHILALGRAKGLQRWEWQHAPVTAYAGGSASKRGLGSQERSFTMPTAYLRCHHAYG